METVAKYRTSVNLRMPGIEGPDKISPAQADVIRKYGHDTATKAQAAAHEAGHVVTACAMDEIIVEARIACNKQFTRAIWLGFNRRIYLGESPEGFTHASIAKQPLRALRGAINTLSGYIGERQVHLDHPSSSLDERLDTTTICTELDRVWGRSDNFAARLVEHLCVTILNANMRQFDMVRGHLTRTKRLTQREAALMLAGVSKIDLAEVVNECVR